LCNCCRLVIVDGMSATSLSLSRPAAAQFDAGPGYLDAATMGLPPRAVTTAVAADLEDWRLGRACPVRYDAVVNGARERYAGMVGVAPEWVAVGSQVSVFAGLVAGSLHSGDEVLVAEGDFSSVVFPFLVQRDRGVRVRSVPVAELAAAVRPSTALVAYSLVQSADGRVADLAGIGAAAARCGARTFVDVTQAVGWLPFDAAAVDYSVCGAYKWLLHPRGTAYFTVRPELLDGLRPVNAGWYAGEDVWAAIYAPQLCLASTARRLDVSPAWLPWVGAAPALDVLTGVGVAAIHAHDVALANAFRSAIGLAPSGSAIVSVRAAGAADRLAAAGLRVAGRAGAARVAFHLWNTADDVARAAAALRG
jgi:selenocysteine lyase/cysteine desulfurase